MFRVVGRRTSSPPVSSATVGWDLDRLGWFIQLLALLPLREGHVGGAPLEWLLASGVLAGQGGGARGWGRVGARGLGGVARQGGPRRAALRGRGAPARSPAHGQRPAFVVVTIVPATRWNDFRSRFFRVPFQAGALVALLGDG